MRKKNRFEHKISNAAKAIHVQEDLIRKSEKQLDNMRSSLNTLHEFNRDQESALDTLLQQAESLLEGKPNQEAKTKTFETIDIPTFDDITPIPMTEWDIYMNDIELYIEENRLKVGEDPLHSLMSEREQLAFYRKVDEDYKMKKANCDKYDYMIATFSGLVTGLIDAFFVGAPNQSKLGKWSDKQVDKSINSFANLVWKHDKKNGAKLRKQPTTIGSSIGFLERRFQVNYDARFKSDLIGADDLRMSPKNHHLKSLGHSPDIVGLFFSILDQFTGKASFISDGEILRYSPNELTNQFELQGTNFISKIFAGIVNWFGHLMSDVAGSSGVRGHDDGRRGSGLPIPFYNLLQMFNFGNIPVGNEKATIAEFSVKVFEEGYDARFGATMAIPVVINELIIRFFWAMKQRFYHQKPITESLPVGNKPELQRMLLVGHGALCLVDGVDALIRSSGQVLLFATRLNMVAWARFSMSAFLEVRRIYSKNALNVVAMSDDVEKEWKRLGMNEL